MRIRSVDLYISLTIVAAVAAVAAGATLARSDGLEWAWWGAALLTGMSIVAERRSVMMPGGTQVSVATIPHLVGALLLPPPVAALVAGCGILIDVVRAGAGLRKIAFNVANTSATVGLAALVANLLGVTGRALTDHGPGDVLRFFFVAVTYYVVSNVLRAGVVSVSGGQSLWRVLLSNARSSAPPEVGV